MRPEILRQRAGDETPRAGDDDEVVLVHAPGDVGAGDGVGGAEGRRDVEHHRLVLVSDRLPLVRGGRLFGQQAPRENIGAGLGLTLVRHFAEAHGGTAALLPRDGGGSSPAPRPAGADGVRRSRTGGSSASPQAARPAAVMTMIMLCKRFIDDPSRGRGQ